MAGASGWGSGIAWLAGACAGLLAVWVVKKTNWIWAGIFFTAFCLHAGMARQAMEVPPDSIAAWMPRQDIRLEGKLRSWPQPNATGRGWQAEMECAQVLTKSGRIPVSGCVKISAPGNCPAWSGGDEVSVRGKLLAFTEPRNPAEFDYAAFERRQGVLGACRISRRSEAVRLRAAPGWSPGAIFAQCHWHWVANIRQWVGRSRQDLVISLVLGDRSGLSKSLQEAMAAAGLSHVLAVSGMNIGLVLASILGLVRWLRIPRWAGWFLGLAGVGLFAGMTGGGASVVRAALMAYIFILGKWSDHPAEALPVLCLAGWLLLIWDPLSGAQPGFLLSFAATAALILAAPKPDPQAKGLRRWLGRIAGAVGLTTVAMAGTSPLLIYYFYSITPVGLVSNLLAIPLVTLITDGGLLLGFTGPYWPWASRGIGWLTGWAAQGLASLAEASLAVPWGRVFLWSAPGAWVAAVYAGVILCFWKPARICGVCLLGFCLMAYPLFRPGRPGPGETRFTFLSLGVGEATLLETGSGQRILIDAGTESEFLWRIKPFLASRGINRLDALMLSHPDSDHAGGTELCLKCFRPRQILCAGSDDPKTRGFRDHFQKYPGVHRALVAGDELDYQDGLNLRVLWPPPVYDDDLDKKTKAGSSRRSGSSSKASANAHSLAVVWSFPGGSALFTGDADEASERHWRSLSRVRLLKVAHHGSNHASQESFLGMVSPELAVVQSGFFGMHRFPHPEAWARLNLYAGQALDTTPLGAVEVTFSQSGEMRWQTWK